MSDRMALLSFKMTSNNIKHKNKKHHECSIDIFHSLKIVVVFFFDNYCYFVLISKNDARQHMGIMCIAKWICSISVKFNDTFFVFDCIWCSPPSRISYSYGLKWFLWSTSAVSYALRHIISSSLTLLSSLSRHSSIDTVLWPFDFSLHIRSRVWWIGSRAKLIFVLLFHSISINVGRSFFLMKD